MVMLNLLRFGIGCPNMFARSYDGKRKDTLRWNLSQFLDRSRTSLLRENPYPKQRAPELKREKSSSSMVWSQYSFKELP